MIREKKSLGVAEFDRLAALPENRDRRLEYIAGELVEVVANAVSSQIALYIAHFLVAYLRIYPIGHVTGSDAGYQVAGERYSPDVAYIRRCVSLKCMRRASRCKRCAQAIR